MSTGTLAAAATHRRGWTAVCLSYAAGVLLVSLLPASGTELATTGPLSLVALDLWFHAVGYTVLAVLAAAAVDARGRRALLAVALAVVLYGLLIEGLQGAVPTRAPSLADAGANASGAAVGVTLRSLAGR